MRCARQCRCVRRAPRRRFCRIFSRGWQVKRRATPRPPRRLTVPLSRAHCFNFSTGTSTDFSYEVYVKILLVADNIWRSSADDTRSAPRVRKTWHFRFVLKSNSTPGVYESLGADAPDE